MNKFKKGQKVLVKVVFDSGSQTCNLLDGVIVKRKDAISYYVKMGSTTVVVGTTCLFKDVKYFLTDRLNSCKSYQSWYGEKVEKYEKLIADGCDSRYWMNCL